MNNGDHPLGVLESEYEIVRELGHGGASVVYLALDRELEREVAIKVVDDRHAGDAEAQARFQREARTLARLQHPNIVQLYQAKRLADGRLALVMQHVTGCSLRDLLLQQGALSEARARSILMDIAGALGFLHQRSIIHRDVKPENIYIEPGDGRALLGDFGIAKHADSLGSVTVTGAVIGTPAYMSPEQVDGHVLDGRSDLYSLGLVAHEMVSGCKPWAGEGIYAIIYKQKHESLPSLEAIQPPVSPEFMAVVETALEKDRSRRWGSAEEMIAPLGAFSLERRAVEPFVGPLDLLDPVEHEGADEPTLVALAPVEPERPPLALPPAPPARRRLSRRVVAAAYGVVAIAGIAAIALAVPRTLATAGRGTPESSETRWRASIGGVPDARAEVVGVERDSLIRATDEPGDSSTDPMLEPVAPEGASTWLIQQLSARISELEQQLTARNAPPRAAPAVTAAPATAQEPVLLGIPASVRAPAPRPTIAGGGAGSGASLASAADDVRLEAPRPESAPPSRVTMPQLSNRSLIRALLEDARSMGASGVAEQPVVLRVLVDVSGRVTDQSVLSSSGNPSIDQAARRIAQRMRFTPATENGEPAQMWVDIPLQIMPR